MDNSILERIEVSQQKLTEVSQALKNRFVGLDEIIDNIILNMTVWHAMPELVGRPVIINLWGMTGVGKTDLVRNLVKELGMADKFAEIQLSNKSQTSETTVQKILTRSAIDPDEKGILLLDEIQRYRTVQADGSEIHEHDFQDVWMLLSDGQFASSGHTKNQLMDMLIEDMYYKQMAEDNQAEMEVESPAKKKKKRTVKQEAKHVVRKYKMGLWSAREFKRTLRLSQPLDEIMQWDDGKRYEMIEASLKDQTTFEGNSYKQLLIFISGNLDEAYEMSSSTGDADVDADIFYEFSKRINFITIKRVLRSKFKPEQIARLGNVHMIYPSLNKASYREIIRRKVQEIIDGVKDYGVEFNMDKSVYEAIYRNGVFPAQGVRPVLSSVNAMLGNVIPYFLMIAAKNGADSVSIKHDKENGRLVAQIGDEEYSKTVEGSVDKIKKTFNANQVMLHSVHEAGHAVVYAVLFKLAPLQIVARSTDGETGGWIGTHKHGHSKTQIWKSIACLLSGLVAEEMIFGEQNRTTGCSSDIANATTYAASSIREWGMNGSVSLVVNKHQCGVTANYDIGNTNADIEEILGKEKERGANILQKYKSLLGAVIETLVREKELSPAEFQKLAASHGLTVDIQSAKTTVYDDYVVQFENASLLTATA